MRGLTPQILPARSGGRGTIAPAMVEGRRGTLSAQPLYPSTTGYAGGPLPHCVGRIGLTGKHLPMPGRYR